MIRSSIIVLLLAFSASAGAQGFSYDYAWLGYGTVDFDEVNADGDGLTLGGVFALTDKIHGFAGFGTADVDSIDVTRWNAGIGYNTSMSAKMDLFARLSYESIDFKFRRNGFDDSGFGVSVGGRFRAGNQIELSGAINHVDFGDIGSDTGLVVGVLYDFDSNWSAGLFGEFGSEISSFTLTGRYYFDR